MARKVHYASGHIKPIDCKVLDAERKARWGSGVKGEIMYIADDGDAVWSTKYTKPQPITRSCITKVTCPICIDELCARILLQDEKIAQEEEYEEVAFEK